MVTVTDAFDHNPTHPCINLEGTLAYNTSCLNTAGFTPDDDIATTAQQID